MRKKIIFLVVCVILFLIFASSSFGDIDPRYKLRAHPWEEMDLCAAPDSTIVTYDRTAQNNTMGVLVIRILGTNIILATNVNSITCPKSAVHKLTIFREK